MTKQSRWAAAKERTAANQRARRPDVPLTAPAPGVVRVDIGGTQRVGLLLGSVLPLLLGVAAEVGAIFDQTVPPHSVPVRIVLAVLGLPFLATGVGLLAWLLRAPPRAFLDVDSTGFAELGRTGIRYRLHWADVTSMTVVRTRARLQGATMGTSNYLRVNIAQHYLRLYLSPQAAARPEIAERLLGPRAGARNLNLKLGVLPGAARKVVEALGPHLDEPGVVRVRTSEPGPGETY